MTPDDLGRDSCYELRHLGELLHDIASGRGGTRSDVVWHARRVVRNLRERDAVFVDDITDPTVNRLLGIADNRYGVEPLMARALAVILDEPPPEPPSWLTGRPGASLRDGEALQ